VRCDTPARSPAGLRPAPWRAPPHSRNARFFCRIRSVLRSKLARSPALPTEATREFGRKSRKNLCVNCCRAAHLDCAENGGMQRARKAAGGRHGQQDSELGKRRCDVAGGPRRTLDRRTRFGRDSSAAAKRTAASVAQCTTGGGKRLEPRCSMDLRDACQARYGRPTSTAHFGLRAGRARSREFVESPKTTESRLAPYPRVLLEIYR
jgi:hypothetical protein